MKKLKKDLEQEILFLQRTLQDNGIEINKVKTKIEEIKEIEDEARRTVNKYIRDCEKKTGRILARVNREGLLTENSSLNDIIGTRLLRDKVKQIAQISMTKPYDFKSKEHFIDWVIPIIKNA